jgi:hypothetical protein
MAREAKNVENLNIDLICDDILAGETYTQIASKYKVTYGVLHRFISNTDNSARVILARQQSADVYDDKAEQSLKDAKSTLTEITRARELASHYRWRAAKRNPKAYGDKLDLTSDNKALAPTNITIVRDGGN